mmetsp:Transcript_36311/g.88704  ORF Transcript_36311/g.88704 Transcript_36311/m.88704 type:complete len:206 (+) Transcript_36311:188-805(+)
MAFVTAAAPVHTSASVGSSITSRRGGALSGARLRVGRARLGNGPQGQRNASVPRAAMERTFIAIKPDGVNRGLVSEIIGRFERKGYKLVGMKLIRPTKELAETHYAALSEKPFFAALVDFIISGPVVAMVWEGKDVVATGRKLIGATNPLDSANGTIRGDFGLDVGRNVVHGSDAVETAEREIGIWFNDGEVLDWEPTVTQWLYE